MFSKPEAFSYNARYYCHNSREATIMKENNRNLKTSSSMALRHNRPADEDDDAGKKKILTVNKSATSRGKIEGRVQTALLWALILYGLLQIAANLPSDNSSHLPELQEEAPTIHQTVILESSLNEKSPNDDGCNRSKQLQKPQLCSSEAQLSQEGQEDRASLIKSTQRPSFYPPSSSLSSVIHSSLLQIFDKLTTSYYNTIDARRPLRSLFGGPIVLMAEAASAPATTQQPPTKGVVVLDSANFNRELLQNRHPFPHIKLIEFSVAYCGFCSKFKPTYAKLAKEIYAWRNVIRPSVIDVGTNLPVANSWHIDTVPTLRIYPPPPAQVASKIDKEVARRMQENSLNEEATLEYLYNELAAAKPMVRSLEAEPYLNDIPAFKTALLDYISSYVSSSSSSDFQTYLPETWPNLRPVGEETLSKLLASHPRQELFLMIQGPVDQSTSAQAHMGLQVMLDLSSNASWKAVRYVKASENKALVEDVILQLKKLSRQPAEQIAEQVEILDNFLMDKPAPSGKGGGSNIVLVHTDDSHSLVKMEGSSFAFISAMTGQDLLNAEQQSSSELSGSHRVRRNINNHEIDRMERSASLVESLPSDLQAELIAKHISHTYTETKEDRKFIRAINGIYRDISMGPEEPLEETTPSKVIDSSPTSSTPLQQTSSSSQSSSPASLPPALPAPTPAKNESPMRTNQNYVDEADSGAKKESEEKSLFTRLRNLLTRGSSSGHDDDDEESDPKSWSSSGDYFDKIKAIRYILFNEIPRASFADKTLSEQQEKLSILLNFVSVIKSYFPMADSSSIQFMDGVHTYLLKQQAKLLSVNNQQQSNGAGDEQQRNAAVFDTRAFKQELKRLESEDKRLPEVKEFKHCAKGGYPCALWRLFHTLTAFEYKKLTQIRLISSQQPSTGLQQQQQPAELMSSLSNAAPAAEPISSSTSNSGTTFNATSSAMIRSNSDVLSPGERLVSPPSTTTSLSLTIVGPSTSSSANSNNNINNQKQITEADLPVPVLLVMRDYITNFFGCTECSKNFQHESADLSLERIRQEPAEFSILWLWETHNRVNKRLSVDPATNPPDNPKMWFPSYEQCSKCYKKQPSFLKDESIAKDGLAAIFYESIDWNRQEILNFLSAEYTKQPMDYSSDLFANRYFMPFDYGFLVVGCICLLLLTLLIRCFTQYVERQRRHKATLLNGSGAHYTLELQASS